MSLPVLAALLAASFLLGAWYATPQLFYAAYPVVELARLLMPGVRLPVP
jgi:hypothetical protein